MIIQIKECCPVSESFELTINPQLDNRGDAKKNRCRVIAKCNGYMILYCPICGTKIEIMVIE